MDDLKPVPVASISRGCLEFFSKTVSTKNMYNSDTESLAVSVCAGVKRFMEGPTVRVKVYAASVREGMVQAA